MADEIASPPRKRKTSHRPKKPGSAPHISAYWHSIWSDPEKAAAMTAKRNATIAARGRRTRVGVPDGMRLREVEAAWAKAEEQANKFIRIMEKHGELPEVVVPDSEEGMAKEALREAFKHAVGPATDQRARNAFLQTVLTWTKAKPEQKTKLTLNKSEEFLAALDADMEDGHRAAE